MERALVLGRYQPFHLGHLELIKAILEYELDPIIAIGSAYESHSLDNPFTAGERFTLIEVGLTAAGLGPFPILPVPDANRNNNYISHLKSLLPPFKVVYTGNGLAHRLFSEAGYDTRYFPQVERDTWEGAAIRQAMLDGKEWEHAVQPVIAVLIKELDGPNRIRAVAGSQHGGPSKPPAEK